MENNAAPGRERGEGGRSYIMCIAHHQRYIVRCISMQGLSFTLFELCIPKFTIYIENIYRGECLAFGILA